MATLQEVEALVARINGIVDAKSARVAKMREFLQSMKTAQREHGNFDDEDIAATEKKISDMSKEMKQYEDLGKKWMKDVGELHEKINKRSKIINDYYDMLQEKDLTDLREKFIAKQRELIRLLQEHTERLRTTLHDVDGDLDGDLDGGMGVAGVRSAHLYDEDGDNDDDTEGGGEYTLW